jgi:hypothetical protein
MPRIINQTRAELYVVCRDADTPIPDHYETVKIELKENYSTPGNYLLLPGDIAEVAQGKIVYASNGSGLMVEQIIQGDIVVG